MCKWSGYTIGKSYTLVNNSGVMCDQCGGAAFRPGDMFILTYNGHEQLRRYGLCDKFTYTHCHRCVTCGRELYIWYDPCGGISSSLFDSESVSQDTELVIRGH